MVHIAQILLASALAPFIIITTEAWNDPVNHQFHIQTDEGPERYFKYQTQNGQYRKEKRLQDGTVIGSYAWIDGDGYLRQRDYIADSKGYRIIKNKNLYVGTNVDVGDAVKAAKKVVNSYEPAIRTKNVGVPIARPIYRQPNQVQVSFNSISSSTEDPTSVYLPPSSTSNIQLVESSSYLPPPSEEKNYNLYKPPSPPLIPPVEVSSTTFKPPIVYIPAKNPVSVSYTPPKSQHVQFEYTTPSPLVSTSYLPPITSPSSTYIPPSVTIDARLIPRPFQLPSSTEVPLTSSTPRISSTTYLPPSESYLPSITPKPFEKPPSLYRPTSTLSPPLRPFEHSSNVFSSVPIPSRNYIPSSTPTPYNPNEDYVNITPPTRKYVPQPVNSNSIEYSSNPQYEHYSEEYVNPYIHQNGPTYPIDTRGQSFNPSYNKIGDGYNPQYPYYDGISVTNDGFRYYIPRAYHEEQNSRQNEKIGSFGYIDPFGIRRVIYYNAGPNGFKHRKNNRYVGFNATPYDPRPT